MCGRYDLTDEWGGEWVNEIGDTEKLELPKEFSPRYNAAPSQTMPVILNDEPEKMVMVRWGLLPVWLNPKNKTGLNNVRLETLRDKHTFKSDLQKRRAIIPATGFYEWQSTKEGKQPYRMTMTDRPGFFMAGLWEINKIDDKEVRTFAIITTTPNSLLMKIHDRMPVILNPGDEKKWLTEPDLDLLNPFSAEKMRAYKVSTALNRAVNDTKTLIEPIEELNSQ